MTTRCYTICASPSLHSLTGLLPIASGRDGLVGNGKVSTFMKCKVRSAQRILIIIILFRRNNWEYCVLANWRRSEGTAFKATLKGILRRRARM